MFNPSFTLIDAMVSYKTEISGRHVTFAANVENLTDKLYFEGNTAAASPRKIFLRIGVGF
jgi:outer membrane receptor protein involved in Fe transport